MKPKLLAPRDIALSIAAIPERLDLPRPALCWGPGFVRCTWSRRPDRWLVVTVTLDPAGAVRFVGIERVDPSGSGEHICVRNHVRYVREGVDWFVGGGSALAAPGGDVP